MVQRSFITGSPWLYYKIYTGPKTADIILTEVILPLVQEFETQKQLQKWFFIRYSDPKPHLRIRFRVTDDGSLAPIIKGLFEKLKPFLEDDMVWKVQLDTYNRELERYGENTMELSESLFCVDSWATTRFLDLIEGDEGEQLRWQYGLRAVDILLSAFKYSLEEKLLLLENLKIGFGREFNMSRPLKKQLDDKYRKERKSIAHFMEFAVQEEPDYEPILSILQEAYTNLVPVANEIRKVHEHNQLQVPLNNLMGSYIHMLMNRLFKSKNRLNEMVCYDFLYRYYKTRQALVKGKINSKS